MPAKPSNPVSRRKILAAKLVAEVVKDDPEFEGDGDAPHAVRIKRAVGRYKHLRRFARGHHAHR